MSARRLCDAPEVMYWRQGVVAERQRAERHDPSVARVANWLAVSAAGCDNGARSCRLCCAAGDHRQLFLNDNQLTGTIPQTFTALPKDVNMFVMSNLLTVNATLYVDRFGDQPFQYYCFDPAVPPSNPSC